MQISALGLIGIYDEPSGVVSLINPTLPLQNSLTSVPVLPDSSQPSLCQLAWDDTGYRLAILLSDGLLVVLQVTVFSASSVGLLVNFPQEYLNVVEIAWRGRIALGSGGSPRLLWFLSKAKFQTDAQGESGNLQKAIKVVPRGPKLPEATHGLAIVGDLPVLSTLLSTPGPDGRDAYIFHLLDSRLSVSGHRSGLFWGNADDILIITSSQPSNDQATLTHVSLPMNGDTRQISMQNEFSSVLPPGYESQVFLSSAGILVGVSITSPATLTIHWLPTAKAIVAPKIVPSIGQLTLKHDVPILSIIYLEQADAIHILDANHQVWECALKEPLLSPVACINAHNLVGELGDRQVLAFVPSPNGVASFLVCRTNSLASPVVLVHAREGLVGLAKATLLAKMNQCSSWDIQCVLKGLPEDQRRIYEQEIHMLSAHNQVDLDYGVERYLRTHIGCLRTRHLSNRLKQLKSALRGSISLERPDSFQIESMPSLVHLAEALMEDLGHMIACTQACHSFCDSCGFLLTRPSQTEILLQVVRTIGRLGECLRIQQESPSSRSHRLLADFWAGLRTSLLAAWNALGGDIFILMLEGILALPQPVENAQLFAKIMEHYSEDYLGSLRDRLGSVPFQRDYITGLLLPAEAGSKRCCTGCGQLSLVPAHATDPARATWMSAWDRHCLCGSLWIRVNVA